ncbi:MAG: hypothetical protein D6766_12690, partial [Verrucomicrobia bacterium]
MLLVVVGWGVVALLSADAGAAGFESAWHGRRVWVGPAYWANPLQDWRVEGEEVVAAAARNRTLHRLTHQLASHPGAFSMKVTVRMDAPQAPLQPKNVWAGFRFAIRGALEDYRHVLIHPKAFFDAGIRADGRLVLAGKTGPESGLDPSQPVELALTVAADGRATLAGVQAGRRAELSAQLPPAELHGNLALVAEAPRSRPQQGNLQPVHWRFRDWRAEGDKIEAHPDQTFGPILWTQYTLSRGVLKLSAQFPPIGEADAQTARLEVRRNGAWQAIATERIHPLARTAVFRIAGWDSTQDTPYRVVYRWQGRDHAWEGVVRHDPVEKPELVVAAFTGDNGYVFPQTRLVRNVRLQNPDLLFFSGDQIYESYGGFGIQRSP